MQNASLSRMRESMHDLNRYGETTNPVQPAGVAAASGWWAQLKNHVEEIKKVDPHFELRQFLLSNTHIGYRLRGHYRINGKNLEVDAISHSIRKLPKLLAANVKKTREIQKLLLKPSQPGPTRHSNGGKKRRGAKRSFALNRLEK